MATQRTYRVGEQIQKEISDIMLRGMRDPRVGFVTITSVDISTDLRHAKIFYTVMGQEADAEKTQQGLDSAVPFLRRELGKRMKLRHVPELVFKYDTSIAYGSHIENLLKEAGINHDDDE